MNEKITSQLISANAIWDQIRDSGASLEEVHREEGCTCEQMDFVFSARLRSLEGACPQSYQGPVPIPQPSQAPHATAPLP